MVLFPNDTILSTELPVMRCNIVTIKTYIVPAINTSQWSNYIELCLYISAFQKPDPLDSLNVLMYSCIPTPLNISHIVFTCKVREVPALILFFLADLNNLVKCLDFIKELLGCLTKQKCKTLQHQAMFLLPFKSVFSLTFKRAHRIHFIWDRAKKHGVIHRKTLENVALNKSMQNTQMPVECNLWGKNVAYVCHGQHLHNASIAGRNALSFLLNNCTMLFNLGIWDLATLKQKEKVYMQ